jgi:hypothetical protein
MNAQINACDSVSYTTEQNQILTVNISTSGLVNLIDSMDIYWQACNATTCYLGFDSMAVFADVLATDTVKVCYDAYIYIDTTEYFCYECDSLFYDGSSWVLLNTVIPNEIREYAPKFISEFYPNPSNEVVYFDYYLDNPAKLIVIDILGNKMKDINLSIKGKQKVHILDLSKGIYFGNLIVDNKIVSTKKIIVK